MKTYSQLSQYYIEVSDEFKGLAADLREYHESGEEPPIELKNEYKRHMFIVETIEQLAAQEYGKTREQLYRDGWDFWFKEDMELRKKRYGKGESK